MWLLEGTDLPFQKQSQAMSVGGFSEFSREGAVLGIQVQGLF